MQGQYVGGGVQLCIQIVLLAIGLDQIVTYAIHVRTVWDFHDVLPSPRTARNRKYLAKRLNVIGRYRGISMVDAALPKTKPRSALVPAIAPLSGARGVATILRFLRNRRLSNARTIAIPSVISTITET